MNFYCNFKADGIDYKATFSIDWVRASYDYNYKLNSDDVEVLNEWVKPRYYFRPTNITSKNQPKVSEQYRINSCLDYLESLKENPISFDAMSSNALYNIVKIVEMQSPQNIVKNYGATKQSWQLCLLAETHGSKPLDSDFESVRLEKFNLSFIAELANGKWSITSLNGSPNTVSWKSKMDFNSHKVEWKKGDKIGTLMSSEVKEVINKYAKPSSIGYGNNFAKLRHESFINRLEEFDNGKLISDEELGFFFTNLEYGKSFFKSIEKYSDTTFNLEITNAIHNFGGYYETVTFNDKKGAFEVSVFSEVNKIEKEVVEKRTKTKGMKAYLKPYTITKEVKQNKLQTTIGITWVYINGTFMIVDDCTLN